MHTSILSQTEIFSCELAQQNTVDYALRMEPTILAQNIATLRAHLGDNQSKFAERIGVPQPYVSKWEKQNNEPSTRFLARLADLADTGIEEFMDFPWIPGAASAVRALNMAHAPDVMPTRSIHADDGVVEITALDLSLSMGPGTLIEDFIEAEPIKLDMGLVRSITRSPFNMLRMVRGIGDSMEPTLRTSDRVLIDTSEKMLSRMHGIYWVDHMGAHGLKRLRAVGQGRVLIMSDNPAVPDYDVDAEEMRIHGRAIWLLRDL